MLHFPHEATSCSPLAPPAGKIENQRSGLTLKQDPFCHRHGPAHLSENTPSLGCRQRPGDKWHCMQGAANRHGPEGMAAQVPPLAQQPAHAPARQAGSRGPSSTSGSSESSTSSSASDSLQSQAAGRNAATEQSRLRPSPSLMHAPDQHRHRSSNRPPSRPGHSRDNGLSRCDACHPTLLWIHLQRIARHHSSAVCCTAVCLLAVHACQISSASWITITTASGSV